jgi:hypothetical protein
VAAAIIVVVFVVPHVSLVRPCWSMEAAAKLAQFFGPLRRAKIARAPSATATTAAHTHGTGGAGRLAGRRAEAAERTERRLSFPLSACLSEGPK